MSSGSFKNITYKLKKIMNKQNLVLGYSQFVDITENTINQLS